MRYSPDSPFPSSNTIPPEFFCCFSEVCKKFSVPDPGDPYTGMIVPADTSPPHRKDDLSDKKNILQSPSQIFLPKNLHEPDQDPNLIFAQKKTHLSSQATDRKSTRLNSSHVAI